MSHHLYVTEGFVLDSRNGGEANKLLYILTRDLGLVVGTAQGARHLKSKLRYHMQHYNFSRFSLVRGKEMWRITGAQETDTAFSFTKNRDAFALYVRVLYLLKRMLNGEESHPELFETLYTSFHFLDGHTRTSDEYLAFENILVLRILNHLGYVHGKDGLTVFIRDESWSSELLSQAQSSKTDLVREINASLKATQL